jgi:uncharacterized protein YodC (DUF2158 family)
MTRLTTRSFALGVMLLICVAVPLTSCDGTTTVVGTGTRVCQRSIDMRALIGQRWTLLDGADGPLGCPVGREQAVGKGRSQQFEHGQIVTSPDQGPNMVVAVYQQDDNVSVSWGDSAPFNYDKWLVRWDKDGQDAGQQDIDQYVDRTLGFSHIQPFASGTYGAKVEGCDDAGLAGSHCRQSWTIRAEVRYVPPPPLSAANADITPRCPQPFSVGGLIRVRWTDLGGAIGPLGCPDGSEQPAGKGRSQRFEHGQIVTSPDQGPNMVVAVYTEGSDLVTDWGDSAPFNYDEWLVHWDKDGFSWSQQEVIGQTRLGGIWRLHSPGTGTYTVRVAGCDDGGLIGPICKQGWTIPVVIYYAINLSGYGQPPLQPCRLGTAGLIESRWTALGGQRGPLGCPVEAEHPVPNTSGRAQQFEHGEIVISPDQGPSMVVAVYQRGDYVVVDWGDSSPFHYDKWLTRWDFKGTFHDQPDDITDQAPASGTYSRYWASPGTLTVRLEGCDSHDLGSSTCRQGWTIPASVDFVADLIDLSANPPATTPQQASGTFDQRAWAVSMYNACLRGRFLGDVNLGGEDWITDAFAMLDLASLAQRFPGPHGAFQAGDPQAIKAGEKASGPVPLGCAGSYVSLRTEVNDALRAQFIASKAGTSANSVFCKRTGEYDVALRGYITMMFRFRNVLDPDVRYHVLQLLNKRGPYDDDEDNDPCGLFRETENHLLQIESSRYLTNQLLFNAEHTEGPLYALYHTAPFDNRANGMDAYILAMLQQFLQNDFLEYNARPYQTYAVPAVLNLADDASDPRVSTGARMVLDYLAAKFAVSDNLLRRSVPYRRRADHYTTDLLDGSSDSLKNFYLMVTGMTQTLRDVRPAFHARIGTETDLQAMAVSLYRPPALIMDLIMNQGDRSFFERYKHNGVEIYSGEPEFLISGGGIWTDAYISLLGEHDPDDEGLALPTVLIPTQMLAPDQQGLPNAFTDTSNFVRIEGPGEPCEDPCSYQNPNGNRVMTCVARDFACGVNPVIPALYLQDRDCWHPANQVIDGKIIGSWTFLDRESAACVGSAGAGYYVAVYTALMDPVSVCTLFFLQGRPPQLCDGTYLGNPLNYGFFEARGMHEGSEGLSNGASFASFWQTVLANNSGRNFSATEPNSYKASDGREIRFLINPPGDVSLVWPILQDPALGVTPAQQQISDWPLVQGNLITSDGHSGLVTITNPAMHVRLILDFRNALTPQEEVQPI